MKQKKNDQLDEIILWLTVKIKFASTMVREANEAHNYGRETYYAAQVDAYKDILNVLMEELAVK